VHHKQGTECLSLSYLAFDAHSSVGVLPFQIVPDLNPAIDIPHPLERSLKTDVAPDRFWNSGSDLQADFPVIYTQQVTFARPLEARCALMPALF
jgi:hypothetical protein